MPIVHLLPDDFSPRSAFRKLARLPGCLWLDSASPGPLSGSEGTSEREPLGRYSFLTADPVAMIVAEVGDPDPWPELRHWAKRLPTTALPGLPPFQGGMAGLWGYEAASWLESTGPLAEADLPTAAVRVGAYDWVIAHDGLSGRSWLISHGYRGPDWVGDMHRAAARREQVLGWLDADPTPGEPESRRDLSPTGPQPTSAPTPPAGCSRDRVGHTSNRTEPAMACYPTDRPGVLSNFTSAGLRAAIAEIIDGIRQGDTFQVNLAQRLIHPFSGSPAELYLRLRETNPAPLGGYLNGGDFQVLSSSPEGFLRFRDGQVETRPIKGTTPRTGDPAVDRDLAKVLSASDKERAENVMIVDLMRNDLSPVCEDDSVEVTQLCRVESYAFVQHLVSVVRGKLVAGVTPIDALAACFPGGSVTGAPKIEAMRTIARLEPNRRGPYCGSLGYASAGGAAEFNILIRTVTVADGWCQVPVGGGITAGSDPASEERETWVKAEGMLRATRAGIIPT
ncbi:MAG: anthranilate synthase component I family protein [Planctomycetaceae bacterium]|nr:MAG: anthranilate synthase component I family protein [Planctomycetaceae bacterium]